MDWRNRAKSIIKSELVKQDIDYIELSKRLKRIGIYDTQINLANKINRGTFSFLFALQIFEVIGVKALRLKD
ncbi:DUF6471 domain-containing protein [Aliarcobacter butzleri]|uniref:DUF6471 domain-containing protein n=1 Tax=Aliarcobacter butzleri TaxID=28197 RepID=UPI001EDAB194|nr:DUF6471 domain-containing protein [Aliarcobacter butzleri]MCG3709107.1 DUF6471 domain-containing protein [Aliarcobacter butzleri]